MARTPRLALWLAALVAGCAQLHGTDAGTGRACPALVGCCESPLATPTLGDYSSEEACLRTAGTLCRDNYESLRAAERELTTVSIAEDELQRLIVELETFEPEPCGEIVTPVPAAVIVRTRPLGSPCADFHFGNLNDCQSGVCGDDGTGTRRCQEGDEPDLFGSLRACLWM